MKLKKGELIALLIIIVVALGSFFGYRYYVSYQAQQRKKEAQQLVLDNGADNFVRPSTGEDVDPVGTQDLIENQEDYDVVVIHGDKEIMHLNSSIDGKYELEGDYGVMYVEVKDGYWRVTEEECPNHICSSIGFVDANSYYPIICVPNNVAVYMVGV